MKVVIKTRSEEELEDYDWRDQIIIKIDGEVVFNVEDDEPEDSNLSRAFNDCHIIDKIIQRAFDAGKNGEELTFEYE